MSVEGGGGFSVFVCLRVCACVQEPQTSFVFCPCILLFFVGVYAVVYGSVFPCVQLSILTVYLS